jgi:hypothetical protein
VISSMIVRLSMLTRLLVAAIPLSPWAFCTVDNYVDVSAPRVPLNTFRFAVP